MEIEIEIEGLEIEGLEKGKMLCFGKWHFGLGGGER